MHAYALQLHVLVFWLPLPGTAYLVGGITRSSCVESYRTMSYV